MIRLLLVDSSRLICGMFTTVLDNEPDLQVISCSTTVDKALEQIGGCDVALVSATLPNEGTYEFIRSALQINPGVKLLVVGLADSKTNAIAYIEVGASGYVYQDDSVDKLLTHIRAAHRGEALLAPDLAAALISRLVEWATSPRKAQHGVIESASLTRREREVLRLMEQDLSNREIASRLVIEVSTVKNHVHNILTKLDVSSRRDLIGFSVLSH